MEQTDFDVLKSLALRDKWDIEALWNRVAIETLERFDAAGWIQLRNVELTSCSSLPDEGADRIWQTPRPSEGGWRSPTQSGESWATYFPDENLGIADVSRRTSWQDRLATLTIGGHGQVAIFVLFKSAPVELCVSQVGRRALIAHKPEAVASVDARVFLPITAFKVNASQKIRMAAGSRRKRMRVASVLVDGVRRFALDDVLEWWPEDVLPPHGPAIHKKL